MIAPLIFEDLQLAAAAPHRFSLEVPAHRTLAIVGEEDSGLEALGAYALALSSPPHGRVLVYGEEIATMARRAALAFRRRVGYLPAGDGLLQNLSLRDNVGLPLRFGSDLPDRDIDGRLQVMLAAARLSRAAHLRPARANEELRRRAALARALAFDPQLVLLDRPFDGLTNRAAAELLALARGGESAEGSRRTVFITGQDLPGILLNRIESRYRLVDGALERED
ncbi:MAG: ATP-binding cassette domain-containing protein [Gemmatimonadetes bacterium]|nr:ATP-binding cassette domain-containing protein [Gemmatimonadota bacterium]